MEACMLGTEGLAWRHEAEGLAWRLVDMRRPSLNIATRN